MWENRIQIIKAFEGSRKKYIYLSVFSLIIIIIGMGVLLFGIIISDIMEDIGLVLLVFLCGIPLLWCGVMKSIMLSEKGLEFIISNKGIKFYFVEIHWDDINRIDFIKEKFFRYDKYVSNKFHEGYSIRFNTSLDSKLARLWLRYNYNKQLEIKNIIESYAVFKRIEIKKINNSKETYKFSGAPALLWEIKSGEDKNS